jgi:hypothetical protein
MEQVRQAAPPKGLAQYKHLRVLATLIGRPGQQ